MTEKKTNILNAAGVPGLVLGGISILYFAINLLLGKAIEGGVGALAMNLLSLVLWAGKLFLCVYFLYMFLKSFALRENAPKSRVFRFGMTAAFYSALLYSAANLVYMLYINPSIVEQSMELVAQTYSNILPADQVDRIMEMAPSLPTLTFFANLIYCWLFGTILSAIFAGRICKDDNPFVNER